MGAIHQVLLAASGAPPSIDPDFASVLVLLHMDGTNGSTAFVDSSAAHRACTAIGPAVITTANQMFGTGSAELIPGANAAAVSVANVSSALNLPADFTIEGWLYPTDTTGNQFICTVGGASGFSVPSVLVAQSGGQIYAQAFSNTAGALIVNFNSGATSLSLNTWQHLALTRTGDTWTLWLDGVSVGTATASGTPYTSTEPLYVGSVQGGPAANGFIGDIDDVRVCTVCRYTSTFTPPTAAFPDS